MADIELSFLAGRKGYRSGEGQVFGLLSVVLGRLGEGSKVSSGAAVFFSIFFSKCDRCAFADSGAGCGAEFKASMFEMLAFGVSVAFFSM